MTRFLGWLERHFDYASFRNIEKLSTFPRAAWAAVTTDDRTTGYRPRIAPERDSQSVYAENECQTASSFEENPATASISKIIKTRSNEETSRASDERQHSSPQEPTEACIVIQPLESSKTRPTFSEKGVELTTIKENGKETYALILTAEFVESAQDTIRQFQYMDHIQEKIDTLQGSFDSAQMRLNEIKHGLAQLSSSSTLNEQDGEPERMAELPENLRQSKECEEELLESLSHSLKQWDDERKLASVPKRIEDRFFFDLLGQPLREGGLIDTGIPQPKPNIGLIPVQLDNDNTPFDYGDETVSQPQPQTSPVPISSSELLILNLRNDLSAQEEKLAEAQQEFDSFDDIYETNLREYNEDHANGVQKLTISDFDRFHVEVKIKMTRELIDAEANLRATRQQARDAGIEHYMDDSSIFQDHPYDGYGDLEDEMIRCCPAERIAHWQETVAQYDPFKVAKEDVPMLEADSWESETVDIGDSISCVGPEPKRRKLAHWNELRRWRRGDEVESVGRPAV